VVLVRGAEERIGVDAEVIFTLLHSLSILNGASFGTTQGKSYPHPIVFRVLESLHLSMGDTYRLNQVMPKVM